MLPYYTQKSPQEDFFEKAIYFLLLIVTFCLPVFSKVVPFVLQIIVLIAMIDNVLSGKFKMKTPFALFLLLFFAGWAGLSLLNSPDFEASFYNYKTLLPQYFVIYWLTISYVKTVRQSIGIIAILLFSALFVSTYGIYQYFSDSLMLTTNWVDVTYFPTLKTRVFSTLYNPNILGSFLVIILALCFGGIFSKIKIYIRVVLVFLAILSVVCLGFTFSRTAWLSFLVVLLYISLLYKRRLLYTLLPISALTLFLSRDMIVHRFLSVFRSEDTSSLLRFALWESTIAMIHNNPFIGIGWNAYQFVYPHYDFFIKNPEVIIYHAHNMYLNIAAEIGLLGLAAFLLLLFQHFFFALNVIKKENTEEENALGIGLSSAFLSVLVGGFTDYTLFNIELASLFWLMSAVSFVLWRNRTSTTNKANICK